MCDISRPLTTVFNNPFSTNLNLILLPYPALIFESHGSNVSRFPPTPFVLTSHFKELFHFKISHFAILYVRTSLETPSKLMYWFIYPRKTPLKRYGESITRFRVLLQHKSQLKSRKPKGSIINYLLIIRNVLEQRITINHNMFLFRRTSFLPSSSLSQTLSAIALPISPSGPNPTQ